MSAPQFLMQQRLPFELDSGIQKAPVRVAEFQAKWVLTSVYLKDYINDNKRISDPVQSS